MKSSAPNNMDARLISRFLEMMSAERGAAANSLTAYARDLRSYLEFLTAKDVTLKAVGTDEARLGAYAGLKAIVSWLQVPLDDPAWRPGGW